MILSDISIRNLCTGPDYHASIVKYLGGDIAQVTRLVESNKPMIVPFVGESIKVDKDGKRITSYGLSSYGYDVRLAPIFKVFSNASGDVIDPLNMSGDYYRDVEGDSVVLPPNSYLLGHTIEHFNIPENVMTICLGKSTWARAGVIVNVTPIEAGFEGQVVIEIANSTPLPIRIHANMGIAQFMFFLGEQPCEISYAKRNGKYQGQSGITVAKV